MALRRKAVPQGARTRLQSKPFAAPSGGWVSATNLALAKPGTAQRLENWIPTTTGIRLRSGCLKHGTAHATDPLESLMSYIGGSTRKLFGSADGDIFDLTSPADEDVPPAASVTGQTSDYYAHINFATPGGNFMLAANGSDEIQTYDGTTWAALVSGGGVGELDGLASDTVDHLNVYRNRIWLTDKTMTAYYLPTDSIAGTVGEVALSGVFRNGGYILFSATWSLDSGDGLDDKIAFVSTEGEIAIYQNDPVDATWGLVGLYNCSPPLGKNAFLKVGGDLLILTEIGLVPLSAIINKDPAALGMAAVSRNIQPDWEAEARQRRNLPWEIVKWTSRNVAYISCPVTAEETITPPICFAVNLETGAWSKVTGWNTRCLALHDDGAYFGTNAGTLMRAEVTGADDGELIYHAYVGHMDHLGAPGQYKTVAQARAVFRTKTDFTPLLAVTTDYQVNLPSYPSAAAVSGSPGEWDVGLWDVALWDAGLSYYTTTTMWTSVGSSGFAHAPILLVTSGSASPPSAELVMFDTTYLPGDLVV